MKISAEELDALIETCSAPHMCDGAWWEPPNDPCVISEIATALRNERAKVVRVEAVRRRVMDHKQFLVEGPFIGRLKIDSWLEAATADVPEQPS